MAATDIGQALYDQIYPVHPELAGKLVGMLMQLGQDECLACLDSIEVLGERLDEAMKILDDREANATATTLAKQKQDSAMSRLAGKGGGEQRVDLEDGVARTFAELVALCAGQYSASEIEEYWRSLPAVGTPAAAEARAKAAAKAQPQLAAATPVPAVQSPAAAVALERTSSAPPPAAAPTAAEQPAVAAEAELDEVLPGLAVFMEEVALTKYLQVAAEWIEEQGACNLDEVLENLEDFAEALALKPLERSRLLRGAEAAASVSAECAARPRPAVAAGAEVRLPAAGSQAASGPAAAEAPHRPTEPPPGAAAPEPLPAAAALEEFPALGDAGSRGRRKKF